MKILISLTVQRHKKLEKCYLMLPVWHSANKKFCFQNVGKHMKSEVDLQENVLEHVELKQSVGITNKWDHHGHNWER